MMSQSIEPALKPVILAKLRPTQMTVGMREVDLKRRAWRDNSSRKDADELGRHLIPVVIGPSDHLYLIDNHHLALALIREGVKRALTATVADLSHLEKDEFWTFMDNRSWLHPFDASGERRTYRDIPKSLEDLADDPYRSLAGALHRAGGYAKSEAPYAEFLWADFLRRRISRSVVQRHFEQAIDQALAEAGKKDANHLPGWCGPDPE